MTSLKIYSASAAAATLSLSLSLSVLFRALVFENEEDEIGVFGKIRLRKKRGEQI